MDLGSFERTIQVLFGIVTNFYYNLNEMPVNIRKEERTKILKHKITKKIRFFWQTINNKVRNKNILKSGKFNNNSWWHIRIGNYLVPTCLISRSFQSLSTSYHLQVLEQTIILRQGRSYNVFPGGLKGFIRFFFFNFLRK